MNTIETAQKMFEDQSFSDYAIEDFVEILTKTDDLYYNDEESFLSDDQYDFLRRYAEKEDPSNVYFTGIGSSVRGGKVKLPYEMGSLDQVYEGEIGHWVKKYNLDANLVALTDKLDGASGMIIYNKSGDLQIGYSRGNGTEGADWYRHLSKLDTVPQNIGKKLAVRGEVIIEKASFSYLCSQITRRSGDEYKNPRNMVSGLMNSKENKPIVYNYIRFVAYQIVGSTASKQDQLRELDSLGFEVVHSLCVYGKELNDSSLTDHLNLRRQDSRYEIDGLVIDVDNAEKRSEMNPTRDTLNPAFAIKYKVASDDNLATVKVIGVEWNISKHGFLKPRVNIEPTDIGGVTINWATGFNAAFIANNGIGKGAVIEITRSGDVIPFIQKVITPVTADMPTEHKWEWNETEIDAVLLNPDDYYEVDIKRMIDFFSKIDAPMLKEGNVQKLYDAGYESVESIITASPDDLFDIIGENGNKIYDGLREKLNDIPLYKIMGAFSTERGIGVRRFKKLQTALGKEGLYKCNDADVIASVDGFDIKTAKQTVIAIGKFVDFYFDLRGYITIAEDEQVGSKFAHMQVCFTGIRDKDLEAKIESLGGKVTSSVSKKTTIVVAKDPNSTTGKPKKAREMGITIMGITEFKEMVDE